MIELMAATTPAHKRLIFEELFYLELGLELKRRRMRERVGTTFATNVKVRESIKQVLPFHPTAAQKARVGRDRHRYEEAAADAAITGRVMSAQARRLWQCEAALVAIENGYQARVLMAPTEILATQHYLSARKLLANAISPTTGKPYRVTLLTGSLDGAQRSARRERRIFRGEDGPCDWDFNALIEDKVEFENLGLVIVDEQHRFGVQQRFKAGDAREAECRGREQRAGRAGDDRDADSADACPDSLRWRSRRKASSMNCHRGVLRIMTRRTTEERANVDVFGILCANRLHKGSRLSIVYPVIEGAKDDQPEPRLCQR